MLFFHAVNLTDEQKSWFITFFKKLCKIGLAQEKERREREERENNANSTPKIVSNILMLKVRANVPINVSCVKFLMKCNDKKTFH